MKALVPIAAALAILPQIALACACCSDPGQREAFEIPLATYDRESLSDLRPEARVRVFMNACGEECVKGISDPQEEYPARVDFSQAGFSIDLDDVAGGISAQYPDILEWFAADVGPLTTEIDLYSEIRLNVVLQADGVFADADGHIGQLVLAGSTNSCMFAGNYRRWSLNVSQGPIDFRLFGDIAAQN